MNDSDVWKGIEEKIGSGFKIERRTSLSGGSINSASRIEGGNREFFVKINQAGRLNMFEAESEGLREMASTGTVGVPQPVACGIRGERSFLLLESLVLKSLTAQSNRILGEQLAAMHSKPQSGFGWVRDNTIGSTLQRNNQTSDWIRFWREHRLVFQLELAETNGCQSSLIDIGVLLCEKFHLFFEDYSPVPSLLHGDLWAGNAAEDDAERPVIFDPACYYGDRECDIAMTELFGGFGEDFYRSYNEAWPLDQGYRVRKTLYNLYHILNHFNLFGGGYQGQAESMTRSLLAELG